MHDASVEMNHQMEGWTKRTRLANQFYQFKQQTIAQYRQFEMEILRDIERHSLAEQRPTIHFNDYIQRINALLDNVEVERVKGVADFAIVDKASRVTLQPIDISSGESELLALSIEALTFVSSLKEGERGLLLLDEPDVHLHPDLQTRLIDFLLLLLNEHLLDIVIATHSTAILGTLSQRPSATVCTMKSGDTVIEFEAIDEVHRNLLPVFGAHPLTSVFAESPPLLLGRVL